jgi:hypothetical protein
MAVTLPEVNNVVPLVKEPQYRVGPGQVAAPMLELAQNLDKAAKETGDVSVLLAHQAGLKAVSRDENGNVTVEHPPIVGPAAIQYQHAVTMAAAADGESVAKLDFVKLRDQHRDDPQGFMTAAQAYRKEKVGQYEKAAGADVGLALGRTIDSLAVENYRGLLNQKESRDLQNSYAAITAQIETTKNELFAIANGGADKNDPAFRQRLQKIGALYGQLTNNPRMGLPREKADYEITQIAAELDVAAMDSKVRDIQFAPADKGGGIEAAYTEAEKIRTDPSLNLTPGQRQAAYSRLIGGIQQRVNAQTQVDKGATAAIKTLEDTAAAGLPIPPAQMATVEQIAIQSGNPGVQLQLQNLKTNAPIIEAWRKQSPEQIERNVAEVERVMQDPSVGATSQLLALRNAGEALAKNARAAIKIDPIGWGNRTGAVPSAPIDLTQPATMQARIASAETVAGILRQAPVYLTPDERTAIEAAVAQGGKPMTDVAQALVQHAGLAGGGARCCRGGEAAGQPRVHSSALAQDRGRVRKNPGCAEPNRERRLWRRLPDGQRHRPRRFHDCQLGILHTLGPAKL